MTRKNNTDALREGCSPEFHLFAPLAKMKFKWISIVYFALLLHWNVYESNAAEIRQDQGQNASCSKDAKSLDSCDGSEVSNSSIYIDFGKIQFQCSCSISHYFSGRSFYNLENNPGYVDCGTAVKITESNNAIYKLPCTIHVSPPVVVLTDRSTTVELVAENVSNDGPTGYCLRVLSNDVSKNVTASCGRSESTTFLQNTKQGLLQSTGSRGSEHTTKSGIQKTDVLSNEDFRDTSADHTTGSTGNGLLIGLIISVILVSISIGISISLALYILRSRKRKSTTKNGENTAEISEPVVTLTPSQNRPASAYATVNPGEVNDPGEEQYTEPVHNRPTSAYTTLNPGEANDPGEQQYTVPVQNHPASAYTTLNPVEANDPGEQQYTGLNIQIGSEVTKTMYSTRPNSNYTTLKLEQDRDDTENYYSGLNNI